MNFSQTVKITRFFLIGAKNTGQGAVRCEVGQNAYGTLGFTGDPAQAYIYYKNAGEYTTIVDMNTDVRANTLACHRANSNS